VLKRVRNWCEVTTAQGATVYTGSIVAGRGCWVSPNEPLRVDPTELHAAAGHLEGHANEFMANHRKTHSRASQTRLGSGLSAAALPQMLTSWEDESSRLGDIFATHAAGHREAAALYVKTDIAGADEIDDAGSAP